MKINLLLTLLAFCLFLAAYIDRHYPQKTKTLAEPKPSSEALFTLRPEEITAVKIIDQQRCLLVRNTPDQPRPEVTEHLLTALAQARITRRFPAPSADLSVYGLNETARHIEVFGEKLQAVTIGVLNPVGNAVYGKRADSPDILLIGGYFLTAFDFALRQAPSVNDSTCVE